jgi:hypothetical protein
MSWCSGESLFRSASNRPLLRNHRRSRVPSAAPTRLRRWHRRCTVRLDSAFSNIGCFHIEGRAISSAGDALESGDRVLSSCSGTCDTTATSVIRLGFGAGCHSCHSLAGDRRGARPTGPRQRDDLWTDHCQPQVRMPPPRSGRIRCKWASAGLRWPVEDLFAHPTCGGVDVRPRAVRLVERISLKSAAQSPARRCKVARCDSTGRHAGSRPVVPST